LKQRSPWLLHLTRAPRPTLNPEPETQESEQDRWVQSLEAAREAYFESGAREAYFKPSSVPSAVSEDIDGFAGLENSVSVWELMLQPIKTVNGVAVGVEQGNEEAVGVEQGNEEAVRVEQGNMEAVGVEQGNEEAGGVEQGNEEAGGVEQGNEEAVGVEQGNEEAVGVEWGNEEARVVEHYISSEAITLTLHP